MSRAVVQGESLAQPLHPVLIHVPIGFFVLSLACDLTSWLGGPNNIMVRGAYVAMLLGVVTAALAAIPALTEWSATRLERRDRRTATTHVWINAAALALYALNLVLRSGEIEAARTPFVALAFSLVGIGILLDPRD